MYMGSSDKTRSLIDVIFENQFGICPICGKPMMLLKSEHQAFTLSSSGWITSRVDQKTFWKVVCPNCEHTHTMKITKCGLTPIEMDDDDDNRLPVLEENPIASKEEDE